MKTNTINLCLYGNPRNVNRICGHYKDDIEIKQIATYTVENGLATIESLVPVYGTQINLPMPFTIPVNDLGSGLLKSIDINCDTLQAHVATCPTQKWADMRAKATPLTIPQQLIADYCGLN